MPILIRSRSVSVISAMLLLSCSSSDLQKAQSLQTVAKSSNISQGIIPNGGSSETGPSNESLPAGNNAESPQASAPSIESGTLDSGSGSLIPSEPAIGPSVIAGATLTCVRTVVYNDVSCQVLVKGEPFDIVPKKIFVIAGTKALWVSTLFRRTNVGTDLTTVAESLPDTFAMALTYGNKQFLIDMVGDKTPEYPNLILDPGFDKIALDNTKNDFSFLPASRLATSSAWRVAPFNSPCVFDNNDSFLDLRGLARSAVVPVDAQRRYANLDIKCPNGGAGVNVTLSQTFTTIQQHYYRVMVTARASEEGAAAVESFGLNFGLFNPDGSVKVYIPVKMPSHEWRTITLDTTADVPSFRYFTQGAGSADTHGVYVDDARAYDLGLPILE